MNVMPIHAMQDGQPPAKIAAALAYLHYTLAARVRTSRLCSDAGDAPEEICDLDPREQATRRAALECLRLYFSGEMDFAPERPLSDDGPDLPPAPKPVLET